MALIRWDGATYLATPLKQLDDGDWLMRAEQHGPRFSIGTTIRVRQIDILPDTEASQTQEQ